MFWFPFVNHVPENIGVWFFTNSCQHTKSIRENATTYKALEMMYRANEGFLLNGHGARDSLFTWFWEANVLNAHAVRNRIKLVKKELRNLITQKQDQSEIKILSLASGSARAVIEVVADLEKEGIKFNVRTVDMSRSALNYCKNLTQQSGITSHIKQVRANVLHVEKYCQDWRPDIVEMVGLVDYVEDKTIIELIAKIYERLNPQGSLIFSNINHNPEKRFVSEIVNWKQLYRTPQQVSSLLLSGGFEKHHCRIIQEPLKIQTVAIGTKAES